MRNFIIGLSLVFFALSGIILFKALSIPAYNIQPQYRQDDFKKYSPPAEPQAATEKPVQEQIIETTEAKDVQAAADVAGEEGTARNEKPEAVEMASSHRNKIRTLAVIGTGAFNSGQVVVNDDLVRAIKEVVPDILSSPDCQVYVEGHTDDIPIKASSEKRYLDNMELSFLRAKAVASILVENGVSADRISVTGYGETRPIAPNESDEGRFKNRRVEIKLVPENKEL
ncbi:MAG: OmpA family protein [Nitrospirota bacterium]